MEDKVQVFNDVGHLEEQFIEIKECAWRKDRLPREFKYTIVDERYFQCMKAMYEKYRQRLVNRQEAEKEVDMLRLRYITDKTVEEKRAADGKADLERHLRASRAQAKLIKGQDMTCREIFEAVFCELIPLLTDEVTGRLIRENAGYKLWTGTENLTEEEKEKITKANKFEKAG